MTLPNFQSSNMPTPNLKATTALSLKDSHILARLFDPESSSSVNLSASAFTDATTSHPAIISLTTSAGSKIDLLVDPKLPPDAHIKDLSLLEHLRNKEVTAVKLAEEEDVEGGLRLLDEIVSSKEGERYASAWVNRAMCKRLANSKRQDEQRLSMRQLVQEGSIISDLRTGISLAFALDAGPRSSTLDSNTTVFLPVHGAGEIAISAKQAKVISQAYTHLGTIYLLLSKEEESEDKRNAEELEELSSRYFEIGGKLGSEIGRLLAVKTNPYAKLCGAMVKEVMKRELSGEGS